MLVCCRDCGLEGGEEEGGEEVNERGWVEARVGVDGLKVVVTDIFSEEGRGKREGGRRNGEGRGGEAAEGPLEAEGLSLLRARSFWFLEEGGEGV